MSLFASFSREELCNLYIYPSLPDVDVAGSSYRITDRDAIRAIFPFSKVGQEVHSTGYQGGLSDTSVEGRIYRSANNTKPFRRLLRDMVWKLSGWYDSRLRQWLDREAPNCIFLAPGYAKFIYDIALRISRERHIPIITYICDDYYFVDVPDTILGRLQLKQLQRKIDRLMEHTIRLITISEEIRLSYEEKFRIKTELIMTGANIEIAREPAPIDCVRGLSYFGNIGLHREFSLADIGRALDEINRENGTDYHLDIYTSTKDAAVDALFAPIRSIRMHGFLTGEAFRKAFADADRLVHVEAFDSHAMDLVKGSVSTKIADSLASGIPLLAYGPAEVASMGHLIRNRCAFVVDDPKKLKQTLLQLLRDHQACQRVVANALCIAREFHDTQANSLRLKSVIGQCLEKV